MVGKGRGGVISDELNRGRGGGGAKEEEKEEVWGEKRPHTTSQQDWLRFTPDSTRGCPNSRLADTAAVLFSQRASICGEGRDDGLGW